MSSTKGFHNLTNLNVPQKLSAFISKGLKFVPIVKPPPSKRVIEAIRDTLDSLNLQKFLIQKNFTSNRTFVPQLYKKSKFRPPIDPAVMDFGEELISDLEINLFPFLVYHQTRTKTKQTHRLLGSLKQFLAENELRLIATDKNLGLALITNEKYKELALKHLADKRTYKRVHQSKEEIYSNHYSRLVTLSREVGNQFKQIANLDLFLQDALVLQKVQIPKFHILAKVHKPSLSGRPIAGAVSWITTKLSAFLSHALRPVIQSKSHILKDSSEFIRNIEGEPVPGNCFLVSLDVEALYPSMQRAQLRKALEDLHSDLYSSATIELFVNLAEFILNATYVQFGDAIFQQIEGMSMGTNAAVELANIYVDYLIEKSVIFFQYRQLFKHYYRFIDDIFFVWLKDEHRLKNFISELNAIDKNLKLTWNTSRDSIPFLDITVFNDGGFLKVKTFQKSMNLYLYIPWDSFHSIRTKAGFIKGELIRYLKTNSNEDDFNSIRTMFAARLQNRGYPAWFIQKCFSQVQYIDRIEYLQPSEKPPSDVKPIFLMLPYHDVFIERKLAHSIRRHWYVLGNEHVRFKPVIAFQKNPNLAQLLTRSTFHGTIEEADIDSESDDDLSLLLDPQSDEQISP
jgi:hypothetical protein